MEKDGGGYDDLVGSGTTGPAALAHGFPSLGGWPKKGDLVQRWSHSAPCLADVCSQPHLTDTTRTRPHVLRRPLLCPAGPMTYVRGQVRKFPRKHATNPDQVPRRNCSGRKRAVWFTHGHGAPAVRSHGVMAWAVVSVAAWVGPPYPAEVVVGPSVGRSVAGRITQRITSRADAPHTPYALCRGRRNLSRAPVPSCRARVADAEMRKSSGVASRSHALFSREVASRPRRPRAHIASHTGCRRVRADAHNLWRRRARDLARTTAAPMDRIAQDSSWTCRGRAD
jgi:hypothetical protein